MCIRDSAKTVLNYLPRESVIHKLTGTTKLAFFLLFTFASMITYNTWVLLGLFAVSLAAFKLSKIKFREVRFMMIFMLVFLVLNNLFIFLFDPNQGTTLYGTRHVLVSYTHLSFSMLAASITYFLLAAPDKLGQVFTVITGNMFANYTMLAAPLFIFMANVLNEGEVTDKLFSFCNGLLGRLKGGTAQVNVFISLIFSGMTCLLYTSRCV